MAASTTDKDLEQRNHVAVIGSEAKSKLYSGLYPIGQRIRISGVSFTVIGVLQAKMQEGDDNINRVIYIPFTTMSDVKDTKIPGCDLVQLSGQLCDH